MEIINPYINITPVGENFRELSRSSLRDAYTWESGVPIGVKGNYVVHFYSVRHPDATDAEISMLLKLDRDAALEAESQPGHCVYIHDDDVKDDGIASSFCVWDSAEFARAAADQPKHKLAVKYVIDSMHNGKPVYENYTITKLTLDRPSSFELILTQIRRMEFDPSMFNTGKTKSVIKIVK